MARLLVMPAVAANALEAVLSDWPLPVGQSFEAGDALATVETEKAVVDVPAEAPGVLLRTLAAIGDAVAVGAPIALLGDVDEVVADPDAVLARLGAARSAAGPVASEPASGEPVAPEDGPRDAVASGTGSPEPGRSAPSSPDRSAAAPALPGTRRFSSPLARRLAKEAGLALADLVGSGPGGRIVRRDVERAREARALGADVLGADASGADGPGADGPGADGPGADGPGADGPGADAPEAVRGGDVAAAVPSVPVPPARHDAAGSGYTDVPHTRMRRAIAERLGRSVLEAPHFAVHGTARVESLLELRARLNGYGGPRVSVNDLVVLAAARAHAQVPAMNVIWMADAVRQYAGVDVAVAVSTDRGLVTPVLRGLDRMSISAVAVASADLVGRARSGRLREDELVGGTLTVTNLGPYGTEAFTAIINPPQSAILAVGAAREEAVVRDGELEVGTVMHVTLSVDHRPVDGAVAAEWMAAFLALVEEPVRILA